MYFLYVSFNMSLIFTRSWNIDMMFDHMYNFLVCAYMYEVMVCKYYFWSYIGFVVYGYRYKVMVYSFEFELVGDNGTNKTVIRLRVVSVWHVYMTYIYNVSCWHVCMLGSNIVYNQKYKSSSYVYDMCWSCAVLRISYKSSTMIK